MAKSCLHILTNNEYATTRCQDAIVLFWPIDGEIELQKFRKSKIIEDDIYISLIIWMYLVLRIIKKRSCCI
ncbi:AraC family transcriptional regulator [Staphylococcus aureus]|nr:AraC family transcriptional regulator [Staphylococcus aureus]